MHVLSVRTLPEPGQAQETGRLTRLPVLPSRREFLTALLSATGAAALGAACSPRREQQTPAAERAVRPAELRFMNRGGQEVYPIHQQVIDAFMREQPYIRVTAEPVLQGSWVEKLVTSIAGGVAPDVVMGAADGFRPLAKAEQILALDAYIARDRIRLDDFLSAAVDSHRYKGKLYGWHYNGGTYAVFYHKGLITRAGVTAPGENWTWDTYLDVAARLTQFKVPGNPREGVELYGTRDLPGWDYWAALEDIPLFTDSGAKTNIAHPRILELIDWLADLMARRLVPSARYPEDPAPIFYNERVVLWPVGYWNVARARVNAQFAWDVGVMPKDKKNRRISIGWYSGNHIVSTTKYVDQAWEFVKFFGNEPGQRILTETGLTMPAVKKLALSDVFLKSVPPENTRAFTIYDSVFVPYWMAVTNVAEFNRILNAELNKVWRGEARAKDVIPPIVPQLNQVLAQN
jgi:multiple sugar transport system substrate-binding protein